ncbi:MAG TPA: bifunctional riboflavin kinase/FAD synthetase [Bacillales bacterium]|nr:bifunctional riboflavin kinase/FAD synthetase [Bacillales bacterium]
MLDFPHQLKKNEIPPLAIALGYFDGVHLGHQKVILEAKRSALEKGLKSAVMTFDPHPSVVLKKTNEPIHYITPLKDKIRIIEDLGIDYIFVVHFTEEFSNLLPQEFVDQYIIGLHVKHVVAGFDYSYGRMGKGTMETLPFHSRGEFTSHIVPKLVNGNDKVSSTLIRNRLNEGNMAELKALMGKNYTTIGTVVHGDKRGRTIGFPTANVDLDDDYIIPPLGVYAVRMKLNGEWINGVCNVGYKPTFNKEATIKPSVEIHLLDFDGDIYGREVEIEWIQYLRKEQKFSSIDELVKQIQKDKQNVLQYFQQNRQNTLRI